MKIRTGRVIGLSEMMMNDRIKQAFTHLPHLPEYKGLKPFQNAMGEYKITKTYSDLEAARVLNDPIENKEFLKCAKTKTLTLVSNIATRFGRYGVSALIYSVKDKQREIYFVKERRNLILLVDIQRKLKRSESVWQIEEELNASWHAKSVKNMQPDFSFHQWQIVTRGLCPEKFIAFDDILSSKPDDTDTRFKRAVAYISIHAFDKAIEDLDIIIKQNPEHVAAKNMRSVILIQLGRGSDDALA